jgi:TPR repeat protein
MMPGPEGANDDQMTPLAKIATVTFLGLAATLADGRVAFAGFDEGVAAAERGDYASAMREWTPLAARGHAGAQFNMGRVYREGLGVKRDDGIALEWFDRAAAQGHLGAQTALGDMHRIGVRLDTRTLNLPRDFKKAAKWYRKAAGQGHADARFGLGLLYEQGGIGLGRNEAEAARWFQVAAEAGHLDALVKLGAMRAEGRGVARDDVLAHMWFNLAATRGTGLEAEVAETQREMAAYRLSSAEIGKAQRLAQKWLERYGTE